MDEIVSKFLKLKYDHRAAFSTDQGLQSGVIEEINREQYAFVTAGQGTFEAYFRRYHRHVYSGMIDLSADHLSYVMRFENLREDFAKVLRILGLEQVRPLPTTNKTPGKIRRWQDYYTPEIQSQAIKVFAPFLNAWSYQFPEGWGTVNPTVIARNVYIARKRVRELYFTRIRYSDAVYAKVVRRIRARLA